MNLFDNFLKVKMWINYGYWCEEAGRGGNKNRICSYVRVLIRGDGDELRLCEGESLDSAWLAAVLCPVLVYFHHMEPGLVFMERLENNHLEVEEKKITADSSLKIICCAQKNISNSKKKKIKIKLTIEVSAFFPLPVLCCSRRLCCLSASVSQMIFPDASSAHPCLESPGACKPCFLWNI